MLQRLIAALLGLLGVASVGLGVASATAWRADDPLIATADPGGDVRTLVTDPGVLELAGDPVTVTVRADGAPVVLAVGRDTDVDAWVGTDPYVRVTGLSDWHTLATTTGEAPDGATPAPSEDATEPAEDAAAEPSPSAGTDAGTETAADPTGSDMWVVEATGDGTATLELPAQDGRWSLLAVSLGDTAPQLDLSWPQTVTTPWLWPGVAVGVLLLAVAAVLLVRILRSRGDDEAQWHSVATGTIAVVAAPPGSIAARAAATRPGAPGTADGGAAPEPATSADAVPLGTVTPGVPLTRRQIREAEQAAAAGRKGRRPETGSVPAVTGALPTVTPATGATPVPATQAGPAPVDRPGTAPAAPSAPAATTAEPAGTAAPGRASRLPWRRGRGQDAATDEHQPATSAPASAAAAWSPDAADAASPGPATGAAPAASATTDPASVPARPAGPAAWTASRPTRPGTTAQPADAPAPSPAAPPVTPAADPDDDATARTQRADAWRRMWGFPADGGETTDHGTDATQGTEEGR